MTSNDWFFVLAVFGLPAIACLLLALLPLRWPTVVVFVAAAAGFSWQGPNLEGYDRISPILLFFGGLALGNAVIMHFNRLMSGVGGRDDAMLVLSFPIPVYLLPSAVP